MRGNPTFKISCQGCRHFFVTHDPQRPWGCRNFGFKGKNLPAEVVYQSTGMQCAYYQRRAGFMAKKPVRRRRKGQVDFRG